MLRWLSRLFSKRPVAAATPPARDLHLVAGANDLEGVRAWLAFAPDQVNALHPTGGETPLHRAASYGHLDAARLLLDAGADPNARAKEGETPLHLAALYGGAELITLLLARGADVNARTQAGLAPLHLAAVRGDVGIARALLDSGADLEARDPGENMPLHRAASEGHAPLVELLLSRGADLEARGYNGMTAESLAVLNRRPEIVALLRRGTGGSED